MRWGRVLLKCFLSGRSFAFLAGHFDKCFPIDFM
jgi:hypothetical protein